MRWWDGKIIADMRSTGEPGLYLRFVGTIPFPPRILAVRHPRMCMRSPDPHSPCDLNKIGGEAIFLALLFIWPLVSEMRKDEIVQPLDISRFSVALVCFIYFEVWLTTYLGGARRATTIQLEWDGARKRFEGFVRRIIWWVAFSLPQAVTLSPHAG